MRTVRYAHPLLVSATFVSVHHSPALFTVLRPLHSPYGSFRVLRREGNEERHDRPTKGPDKRRKAGGNRRRARSPIILFVRARHAHASLVPLAPQARSGHGPSRPLRGDPEGKGTEREKDRTVRRTLSLDEERYPRDEDREKDASRGQDAITTSLSLLYLRSCFLLSDSVLGS